jgi:hypothetical protein
MAGNRNLHADQNRNRPRQHPAQRGVTVDTPLEPFPALLFACELERPTVEVEAVNVDVDPQHTVLTGVSPLGTNRVLVPKSARIARK